MDNRNCETCKKPFAQRHPSQRFCSRRCKDRYWNGENGGEDREERTRQWGQKMGFDFGMPGHCQDLDGED